MLDWSKDPPEPIIQSGQTVMYGAGSKSVRKAIEKYQPMLGLAWAHPRIPICSQDWANDLHQPRE